jgi:hypothetical protein
MAGLAGWGGVRAYGAEPLVKALPNAEQLGWRVGFSAYTFRALTAFETLDKITETGLHYTELFAWQKLSPQHADAQPGPRLSQTLRGDVKKIWGQGKGRIAEILAKVKRQKIQRPYFGIEWERTADSEPSLYAQAVAFFEKTAGELAAA